MSNETSVDRYSTVADFELIAHGRSYSVGHVAPAFLILETSQEISPGDAELIIRVEDEVIRRKIALPEGSTAEMRRVPIQRY